MPDEKPITKRELDSIARLGLDDLRAYFSHNAPEGAEGRAKMALRVINQGTQLMDAESTRLSIALKIARSAGITREDQHILWKQLTSGSE